MMIRSDKRRADELRPVTFELGVQRDPAGSVLVRFGNTAVICAATVSKDLPAWMGNSERGWITAEYAMMPGSARGRIGRKAKGRSAEIQRLIGRSLRAAVALDEIQGLLVTIDCDVLQADGGTRTASVTGGYVALALALAKMVEQGELAQMPRMTPIASISCGIVDGVPLLDLNYNEDSSAQVDMNFVMDGDLRFVEVQGTGEGRSFSGEELESMMELARKGVTELLKSQQAALRGR